MGNVDEQRKAIAANFLEAAKILIGHALELDASYFNIEIMIQEVIVDVKGESLYCDIHK